MGVLEHFLEQRGEGPVDHRREAIVMLGRPSGQRWGLFSYYRFRSVFAGGQGAAEYASGEHVAVCCDSRGPAQGGNLVWPCCMTWVGNRAGIKRGGASAWIRHPCTVLSPTSTVDTCTD